MRFGRLVYGNNPYQGKHQLINIGDFFQTFAMDALLESCGVLTEPMADVERHAFSRATDITLPMVGVFTRMRGKTAFPLPASVRPLFFGYHNLSRVNRAELKAYLSAGFVGCRDEATYASLAKKGVNAYITGCATLALKTRKQAPKAPKIFLVDTPASLKPYLPNAIKKSAIRLTQEVSALKTNTPEALKSHEEQAIARLNLYKQEAGLVITSRLHCAAPCIAMGIPVILVREYFDERYSFIDKFLPLYTPERFREIDWLPKAPDLTEAKQLLKAAFCAQVLDSADKKSAFEALDAFYRKRERAEYHTPLKTRVFYVGLRAFPRFTTTLRNKWLKRFSVLGED